METQAQRQLRIMILKTQILISNPSPKAPDHKLSDAVVLYKRYYLGHVSQQQQVRTRLREMQKCTWVPGVTSW